MPIKDPKLSFSIVYTNQPVPPPWLNGGDLGRDVINYYFRDRDKKMIKMNLTLTINNKTKALMKIVTLITMIIRFDNKLLIKSSLQLLM